MTIGDVMMNIVFELGSKAEIEELAQLYDNLNDYLEKGTNYPGWKKNVYPTIKEAEDGVENASLYVAKDAGKIVGSIILNHHPERAYYGVQWGIDVDYADVIVIHTLVVDPAYHKHGIGGGLMNFADQYCLDKAIKSIRLDVYEKNAPAIKLYEKCGFKYIDTVDLGLGHYGLNNFKLYEKLLQSETMMGDTPLMK